VYHNPLYAPDLEGSLAVIVMKKRTILCLMASMSLLLCNSVQAQTQVAGMNSYLDYGVTRLDGNFSSPGYESGIITTISGDILVGTVINKVEIPIRDSFYNANLTGSVEAFIYNNADFSTNVSTNPFTSSTKISVVRSASDGQAVTLFTGAGGTGTSFQCFLLSVELTAPFIKTSDNQLSITYITNPSLNQPLMPYTTDSSMTNFHSVFVGSIPVNTAINARAFYKAFGTSAVTAPEPASLTFLLLGVPLMIRQRKTK
jgi:hypothetical protein